jgi:F-type H+-transporting ATPase subunit epsilon
MAASMHVEVVSAEQHVFTADIAELYARGVEGEIGILPGHQPAVIALDVGAVTLVLEDGTREYVAVHRGVLFVGQDGRAIVLADIAELASDIDVARAEATMRELEQAVAESEDDPVLKLALRRQQVRLQVAGGDVPVES